MYAAFTTLGSLRRHDLTADSCAVLRSNVFGTQKSRVGKRKLGRRFPSSEDINSRMIDYLMMSGEDENNESS